MIFVTSYRSIALLRHQGHIGAALVLGGVDATGPHLFTIHPHGSTDKLPYVTMGSGSLAAMAVFESGWKPDMSVCPFVLSTPLILTELRRVQREDALAIVTAAISAGIFNDLGSGSNVDACVITANSTEMLRNFVRPNERAQKERRYRFREGTTAWTAEKIRSLVVEEKTIGLGGGVGQTEMRGTGEEMDTS